MQKGEISKICLVLYFNSSAQTASIYLFIYLLICYLPICLLIYSSYIVDINSENTLFYIRIAEINKYCLLRPSPYINIIKLKNVITKTITSKKNYCSKNIVLHLSPQRHILILWLKHKCLKSVEIMSCIQPKTGLSLGVLGRH